MDALRRRSEYEASMEEEFHFHIEQETAHNIRQGMEPDEARRVALTAFGGVEYQKERYRDQRGLRALDDLAQDIGHARRSVQRHPGIAASIVLVSGTALGVLAAAVATTDQVLSSRASYAAPDELVLVRGSSQTQGPSVGMSWPDFWDLRERLTSLSSVAVFENGYETPVVLPGGRPALLAEGTIGFGFLDVLGVRPAVGRGFTQGEHGSDAPVVMITHEVWEGRFGGTPDVLSGFIELGGQRREIVGVLPEGLDYPIGVDFVTPERDGPPAPEENLAQDGFGRTWRVYDVVGRLDVGVRREALSAELELLSASLSEQFPETNAGYRFRYEDFEGAATESFRTTLNALMAAALALLLVATVNVTALLVSRGLSRSGEIAIRLSLGGGRARIFRQLLVESSAYAAASVVTGLLLGTVLIEVVAPLSPWSVPGVGDVSLSPRVVYLCLVLSLGQFVLACLVGALQLSDVSLDALTRTGTSVGTSRRTRRVHEALVGLQVACGTLLMLSSVLVGYSYLRLGGAEPGFQHSDDVLSVRISLQAPRYAPWDGFRGFFHELLDSVSDLPDVVGAGLSFSNPVEPGRAFLVGFEVEEVIEPDTPAERPQAAIWPVSPGYFETVGLEIVRGRPLSEADVMDGPGAVVVNEAFVRVYLDGVEPIGRILRKSQFWDPPFPDRHEIVGVAADVRVEGARVESSPAMYFPFDQTPFGNMRLLVRGREDAASLGPRVRDAVWSIDPQIPLERMAPLNTFVSATVARERFAAVLIVIFAVVSLALTAAGLFAVAARGVTSRRNEYGIRRAMGATPTQILGGILTAVLRLTAAGWALGVLAFALLHTSMTEYLFEVGPFEPWVHLSVALGVLLVSVGSSWWPARSALGSPPAEVLRDL